MRAVVSKGTDAELKVVEVPSMSADIGQVVVDVRAIGAGRVDLLMRQVIQSDFVPGVEVAGIVAETGSGVDPEWRGRRVFARLQSGAYADQVVVSSAAIVVLPDSLSFEAAVASGVNALVAHFSLARAHAVGGERVAVRGARGGIGHLAVQMAKSLDAEVLESLRHGEPVPADVIIDLVAGADTGKYLDKLNANGRYVIAGISGGMPPASFASTLIEDFRRSRSIMTLSLDTITDLELNQAAEKIFADVEAGKLVPTIAKIFPLAEAKRAHHFLAGGGFMGKIILMP